MFIKRKVAILMGICTLSFLVACTPISFTPAPANATPTLPGLSESVSTPLPTSPQSSPTPTPSPQRVLTICTGQEPATLFIYGGAAGAAVSVWEAIYDGPFDHTDFDSQPVIFLEKPALDNQGIQFIPKEVAAGETIIDSMGNWATLSAGARYRPSGCLSDDCAQVYSGSSPVMMDQAVVRFRLRPDLRWSDGAPLTAADSVYSYEVARQLYPAFRHEIVALTQQYEAFDTTTISWIGVPGYQHIDVSQIFFTPLPQHVWGTAAPADLASLDIAARYPLGWGAYAIEEWTAGDHITLRRNPHYFRTSEGLPYFERLVFRFVSSGEDALAALLSGECDAADASTRLNNQMQGLKTAQANGRLQIQTKNGTALEQLVFGITPSDPLQVSFFASSQVRQGVAYCLDRRAIALELGVLSDEIPASYITQSHPYANPDVSTYEFDPVKAGELLTAGGWEDTDGDPSTPRTANGVPGVPNGAPFVVPLLSVNQTAASLVRDSLAQCGIQVETGSMSWSELFAPGPEGPIFGRKFQLALFAWTILGEPPCSLYTTGEIPGPHPAHAKGWGGANAAGYSSPEYDQACQEAMSTIPGLPENQAAHHLAQSIFTNQLPVVPLYFHTRVTAARADLCGLAYNAGASQELWNIESWTLGTCP